MRSFLKWQFVSPTGKGIEEMITFITETPEKKKTFLYLGFYLYICFQNIRGGKFVH